MGGSLAALRSGHGAGAFVGPCRRRVDCRRVAIVASMWAAMTLAMMLPSAAPMILTYAEIADTAARKGERIVSPFVLAAGYTAVWLGFAVARDARAIALTRAALLDSRHGVGQRLFSGAIFIGAGRLPVLRAQACLPDAMPAAVSVFLRQLGDDAARRVPARRRSRACTASAAAGR